MALVDITNDWVEASQSSGLVTYDDGSVITYTYSVSSGGIYPGEATYSPSEITEGGQIEAGEHLMLNFDAPATGLRVRMSLYSNTEETEFIVNGESIDLNTWLAEGKISFSGEGAIGDGSNLINASGKYDGVGDGVGGGGYTDYTSVNDDIIFHVPITSIVFKNTSGTDHANGVTLHDFFIDTAELPSLPCFTAGTLIDTDQGAVPVETLQAGDMIKTKDHGFQPVKWVGGSRVMDAPVRIAKGTFGNARDLVVSPRHRMLLQGWQMGLLFNHDEAFATAYDLKNGTTITQEPEGWVEYFHILLDRHEVIYAEGAETESFFPDEASLNSMAKKTREELAKAVDLSTFGRTVRPTLTANQAMYLSHNMDLLEDTPNQIAAQ